MLQSLLILRFICWSFWVRLQVVVARKFIETASLENLHKNELCTLSFTFLLQATSVSTKSDSSTNTHVSLNASSYIIWNWHNLKILFLFFFFFMMSLHKSASLLCTNSFIIQESALHSKYDTSYLALIMKKILIPGILDPPPPFVLYSYSVCTSLNWTKTLTWRLDRQ